MLTKGSPFDPGATALATLLKRRHDPPRPLRAILPEASPRWEETILRCLELDPARRFSSAGEMTEALRGERPVYPEAEFRPGGAPGGGVRGFVRKLRRR